MMGNLDFKGEYKRHLPHLQPPGATFFITTRLAGSLPRSVLGRMAREKAAIDEQYAADMELAERESEWQSPAYSQSCRRSPDTR